MYRRKECAEQLGAQEPSSGAAGRGSYRLGGVTRVGCVRFAEPVDVASIPQLSTAGTQAISRIRRASGFRQLNERLQV